MAPPPTAREAQATTLEKFINDWHTWTPEAFVSTWTDDCTQTSLPLSLGIPTRPRAELEKFFPHLISSLTNFKLKVNNVVHDSVRGSAVIYAVTDAETPVGPYHNEHALCIWFDESGEKIARIEEMFDAITMSQFLPKLKAYLASQRSEDDENS